MLLSVGASSTLVAQHGMTQGAPWLYSKSSAPVPAFLRQNSTVSSGESVIAFAIWNRSFVSMTRPTVMPARFHLQACHKHLKSMGGLTSLSIVH